MSHIPPAARLRDLLSRPGLSLMPCAWDALSARIISRAGFPVTMTSGFAVSGARLGMPDTGLISFAEMADQLRLICQAAPGLLVIGDGDTGYGNPLNVHRTVREYARAGAAGIMIEDQVSPKKCGHTKGKQVVSKAEARMRIRAAVDAARSGPADILILARTDARAVNGFEDAMERCAMFAEEGADMLFLEAPTSVAEMETFCAAFDKPCLANMVAGGHTPILPAAELERIGFRLAAYPLIAFSAAVEAILRSLDSIRAGRLDEPPQVSFEQLKEIVGFNDYYATEERYRAAE
jgi:2-methylisocitrate lyase-like PEP mutase family enzyme